MDVWMVLLSLIYLFIYSYFFIYSFYLFCTYLPALTFTLCYFNTSCMLLPCFYYICTCMCNFGVPLFFAHDFWDCSVLLFIPIFCINAHDLLLMRGCVWMGLDAWIYVCVCVCICVCVCLYCFALYPQHLARVDRWYKLLSIKPRRRKVTVHSLWWGEVG